MASPLLASQGDFDPRAFAFHDLVHGGLGQR